MSIGKEVFLNREFVAAEEAAISPFERGFLFAHAAYEVTAVYNGKLVDADGHMVRLARTLEGIDLSMPASAEDLTELHIELMERNGLTEGLIYMQVSAGSYGFRDFAGPEDFDPSLFLFCTHKTLLGSEEEKTGVKAVLLEDTRWKRRDMKTTQLLSQALAYREARRQGAFTAWMVEEGEVTEAASANAWIVKDGVAITRPLSWQILPGITRQSVIAELEQAGVAYEERAFTPAEAKAADEAFTTSTGVMILPIVQIDDQIVGDGKPGPVTRQVQNIYARYIGAPT
ncbi:MAG: aminotransferase class IV [Pseudomonadota bacterium]